MKGNWRRGCQEREIRARPTHDAPRSAADSSATGSAVERGPLPHEGDHARHDRKSVDFYEWTERMGLGMLDPLMMLVPGRAERAWNACLRARGPTRTGRGRTPNRFRGRSRTQNPKKPSTSVQVVSAADSS